VVLRDLVASRIATEDGSSVLVELRDDRYSEFLIASPEEQEADGDRFFGNLPGSKCHVQQKTDPSSGMPVSVITGPFAQKRAGDGQWEHSAVEDILLWTAASHDLKASCLYHILAVLALRIDASAELMLESFMLCTLCGAKLTCDDGSRPQCPYCASAAMMSSSSSSSIRSVSRLTVRTVVAGRWVTAKLGLMDLKEMLPPSEWMGMVNGTDRSTRTFLGRSIRCVGAFDTSLCTSTELPFVSKRYHLFDEEATVRS